MCLLTGRGAYALTDVLCNYFLHCFNDNNYMSFARSVNYMTKCRTIDSCCCWLFVAMGVTATILSLISEEDKTMTCSVDNGHGVLSRILMRVAVKERKRRDQSLFENGQ